MISSIINLMKKLLFGAFLLAVFIPFSRAEADVVAPWFTLNDPVYNSSTKTVSYTAGETAGYERDDCGPFVPFDEQTGSGYTGGFTITNPYMMSGGTATVVSITGTPAITKKTNGETGVECSDPERSVTGSTIDPGTPGTFSASGSLNVSTLTAGTYDLSLTLCAQTGTCRTQKKSFVIPAEPLAVKYRVTSSVDGTGGTVSPGFVDVDSGATASFTITPNANNYPHLNLIEGTCPKGSLTLNTITDPFSSPTYTYTTGSITGDCNVSVKFMRGTLTPSPTACTILAGASSCDATLSWTTTNPVAVSKIVDSQGNELASGNSGSQAFPVPYTSSPKTFYLKNNSITLAQSTATASCPTVAPWDGSKCSAPALYADLTVPSMTNTTAVAGSPITFTATIKNSGDADAGGTITHLFQFDENLDHTVNTAKTANTTTTILALGGTASVSTSYTFATAGDKYYRACADNDTSFVGTVVESNEGNNCRFDSSSGDPAGWIKITVAAAPINGQCSPLHYNCNAGTSSGSTGDTATQFKWNCVGSNGGTTASCTENKYVNLTAATPPSSQNSAEVDVPKTFTSSITNLGNIPTPSGVNFPILFQTSPVSNFSSGVTDYRATDMSPLGAGASATASKSITFPVGTPSIMYVRACADKSSAAGGGVITESNENDNCGGARQVTVSSGPDPELPDLTASAVAPTTATAGVATSFSGDIINNGEADAPVGVTHIFQFDEDADHSEVIDEWVTTWVIIPAGGKVNISSEPYVFSTAGTKYVRLCADKSSADDEYGTVVESNEDNNCTDPWTEVEVSEAPPPEGELPDLIAGNVTPYNAVKDEPRTFSITIQNNGGAEVSGSVTHIFQYDEDSNHTSGVANVEVISTSAIPAGGGSVQLTNAHTFTSVGQRYVRACADADESGPSETGETGTIDEGYEDNNCSPQWTSVTVSLPACEGAECEEEEGVTDGDWSDWSYNGVINGCSATCTNEVGYQVRTCTNPEPSGGGKFCVGDSQQACFGTQDCSANPVAKPGACAPKYYGCALGDRNTSPKDTVSAPNQWTWICTGVNGGADASCSETKKQPIFIED